MLQPVERRSLSEAVFEQLRDRILEGQLEAGARLPAERALCAQLGVNRNALREGLKRLQQLGLIEIHPGGSTRVLDFHRTGGLDVLAALLLSPSAGLRIEAARSLVELRTALGPDIAGRAAQRGGPAIAGELRAELERMERVAEDDVALLQRHSLEIWHLLVGASENLAYRLAFNTMERAYTGIRDLVAPALADELRDRKGYQALVRAVESGDSARARRAAQRLVEKGEQGLMRILDAAAPAARRAREEKTR